MSLVVPCKFANVGRVRILQSESPLLDTGCLRLLIIGASSMVGAIIGWVPLLPYQILKTQQTLSASEGKTKQTTNIFR